MRDAWRKGPVGHTTVAEVGGGKIAPEVKRISLIKGRKCF